MHRRILFLPIIVFLLISCFDKQALDFESYSLKMIQIYVDSEDLSRLRLEVKEKMEVPANFFVDDVLYRGHISPSGKASLLKTKRSYNLVSFRKKSILGRTKYRLSAQSQDNTHLRSFLGFHIFNTLGLNTSNQEAVAAYLNEEYIGLYHLLEIVDSEYFESRGIKTASIYKAKFGRLDYASLRAYTINDLSKGFKVVQGTGNFEDLKELIRIVHIDAPQARTDRIEKILDVTNYLSYLAGVVYLNAWDNYINNYIIYRDASDNKFRFVPWDLDSPYSREHSGSIGDALFGEGGIADALLQISSYETQYRSILSNLANTTMPYSSIQSFVNSKASEIESAFNADSISSNAVTSLTDEKNDLLNKALNWTNAVRAGL